MDLALEWVQGCSISRLPALTCGSLWPRVVADMLKDSGLGLSPIYYFLVHKLAPDNKLIYF